MQNKEKTSLFGKAFFNSRIKSVNVKPPEMLFGYFIGPFGALLSGGIFTSILQMYFTDVLFPGNGDALTFLMVLQLASTALIVIGNIVVGQLIERTKTLQGKARPWILLSALTLSVSSVLMFIMPFEDTVARMVWIGIAYNLFYSVAYPIYNTANSTLIPISTRNMKQRSLLASVTNVAQLGVMGAGSMVFPALLGLLGTSIPLWFAVMLGVAIFGFLTISLQYMFTRERVTEETKTVDNKVEQKKVSLGKQLKAVTSDKMWWFIIIFYLIFQWSGAMKNGSMAYFCKWVLDNSFWENPEMFGMSQSILAILGAIPMAIAVAFVWPLSNKFGKKNLTVAGMALGVIGGVIAIIGGDNIVPVAIGIALKCLGSAPACYLILAMLADVLDHIEAKKGFRCDGLTMSIYSSIMVAATPICNAIISGLLGATGYDGNLDVVAGAMQNDMAKSAISASYIWVETIAYGVCGLLLLLFTVEKNVKNEQLEIRERQKAETLARGEEWVDPEVRMQLEQDEQDRLAEESRVKELKAACEKKGLDFEAEEAKYQAKLAEKKAKAEAKAAARAAKKIKGVSVPEEVSVSGEINNSDETAALENSEEKAEDVAENSEDKED